MYVNVVFNRPLQPLTYEVPQKFGEVKPGQRVIVPLREKACQGIVYSIKEDSDRKDLKQLIGVIDSEPLLNSDLIELAEWMARYYLCSIGEAMWTLIPKGIKKKETTQTIVVEDTISEQRDFELTDEQKEILKIMKDSLENGSRGEFLLYGVTGSGKTEVYLRIIEEVLKRGRGGILLVPEISLTPQTVRYFSARMGDELAVLHSRLTKTQKLSQWQEILRGKKKVVIGARSAIFAPVENIGVIIIDEEHETSYKSDETPRYNAKTIAYYRAQKHNSILVFGSATPSVESFYMAKAGKLRLLTLSKRVGNQPLPSTKVSDLRRVKGEQHISKPLIQAIMKRLKSDEQIILFLNRRGYAPYVYCTNCGYVFRCKNCDISMTLHKKEKRIVCHYCGYWEGLPDVCPNCSDERIELMGFGTEKIEKSLKELFPGAIIKRMDTDTVKRRTAIYEILSDFGKQRIDILVGTQIVSKGLHFPNVTLVGVLNADISLNFPDFRAAERTFNLITQVSGRAGRGEKKGDVIIQTYNPSHYAIQCAKSQDYEDFFVREIRNRQNLRYPPFCRIVRLVVRGKDRERVFNYAYEIGDFIKSRVEGQKNISVLGPVSCPISRIKKNYRVHIIIKTDRISPVRNVLALLLNDEPKKYGVYLEIDFDPLSML